jgi:hypothetical protein
MALRFFPPSLPKVQVTAILAAVVEAVAVPIVGASGTVVNVAVLVGLEILLPKSLNAIPVKV